MKILVVDATATKASAALLQDEKVIGEFYIDTAMTHSQTLVPMVDMLLSTTRTDLADVDLFAVTCGPGSFTGLRIGVSAVKGLALGQDKPCFGVSTLEAIAYGLRGQECIACAVMDARCKQVYNAFFEVDGEEIRRLTPDAALPIDEVAVMMESYGDHRVILVGDGADLCAAAIEGAELAPSHIRYQHASSAALSALAHIRAGEQPVDAGALQLSYLRLPQAQRERQKRLEAQNR